MAVSIGHITGRARWIAGVVAIVILLGVAVASLTAISPPQPVPSSAPAGVFSADRAYQHVRQIGAHVHVTGSDAATDVRDYITDALRSDGYHPQVHEGIGQTDALGGPAMAHVNNVVTTIPGRDSTGTLILMAHYDSVQVSYGANDDGSGVAVLLETARALSATSQLRNDVILLFTDAEEACLCGAESFVHSDPLATDGGVVLNFESRGTSGPSIMFETSAGNSALVAHYAAAVPYPVATSMAVEVYRILPNDTDFTPFLAAGRFTGLNSAYIDGSAAYHSPEDRPEYMDVGTLQAHGANALALARQLGDADLAGMSVPASRDSTYFPILGSLVVYSGLLVWPLAILALAAVVFLAVTVQRRYGYRWRRLATSFAMMLVPLVGAAVLAQLYWWMLETLRPGYAPMSDPWHPGWYRVALCGLIAALVVGWFASWRRRFGTYALVTGGLAWLALLGVVMALVTPGGSYLAVVPAMIGALMTTAAVRATRWWVRLVCAVVAGVVAVLILAPTVMLFFPALGLATGAAPALFLAMLLLVLLPAIDFVHPQIPAPAASHGEQYATRPNEGAIGPPDSWQPPGRWVTAGASLVALAVAVVGTVVGLAVDRFDPAHPAPSQLMYALDADSGDAYWVSEESDPTGWTASYLTGEKDLSSAFPMLHGPMMSGPAPSADLPAPGITVISDTSDGDSRTLTLEITPNRPVRLLDLTAPDAHASAAFVTAGTVSREIALQPDGGVSLLFHGPADAITVSLVLSDDDPVHFRLLAGSDGLTGLPGFTARPSDVGAAGSHTSDLVLVGTSLTV